MKFGSLNVRGLADFKKHKSIFNFIKSQKIDVCLLQETHIVNDEENILWQQQLGGKSVFSLVGTSQSRGVTIVINPKLEFSIETLKTDTEDQILILNGSLCDKKVVICNIYAPNTDELNFFKKVIEMLNDFVDRDVLIIGGDFNLVMNPEIDRQNSTNNHNNSLTVLQEYMEKCQLSDVFCIQNPESRSYTWCRSKNAQGKTLASHIDMFLISDSHLDCVEMSDI